MGMRDLQVPGGRMLAWFYCFKAGVGGSTLCSFCFSPQIPIAMSGIRGIGFLMKYHIETGDGQLPPRLSSLLIKVSRYSS